MGHVPRANPTQTNTGLEWATGPGKTSMSGADEFPFWDEMLSPQYSRMPLHSARIDWRFTGAFASCYGVNLVERATG